MRIALILAALLLAGCSTPQATKVDVVTSTFCQVAEYYEWSIDDTQETVNTIRRHNARVATCKKAQAKVS